jgi:hypothetical protein
MTIRSRGWGEDGMRLHTWAFDDPSMFERVFGNLIDQQFLAAGLVDEIRIHLIDVLLRGGSWLFDELRSESSWNRPGSARPAGRRISSTASSGSAPSDQSKSNRGGRMTTTVAAHSAKTGR